MSSKFWLKLPHRLIHEPEVMMLAPRMRLLMYDLALVAGDYEKGGELPPIRSIAYTLRADAEELETDMVALAEVGVLSHIDGKWYHAAFRDWQEPVSGAARVAAFRNRQKALHDASHYRNDTLQKGYDSVTFVTEEVEGEVEEDVEQKPARTNPVRATPTPDSAKKQQSKVKNPYTNHPAMNAYRSVVHRYVHHSFQEEVAKTVGEGSAEVTRWAALVREWCGRGWNDGNVSGMLEAFRKGGIPQRATKEPVSAPVRPRTMLDQQIEAGEVGCYFGGES